MPRWYVFYSWFTFQPQRSAQRHLVLTRLPLVPIRHQGVASCPKHEMERLNVSALS